MCLARQEMGEDAMLVHSRRSLPEVRHLGAYEVVFAASQDPALEAAAARTAQPVRPPKAEAAPDVPVPAPGLSAEMAEMRRQLARISAQVSRSTGRGARRPSPAPNPALDELEHALASHGVDDDLSYEIVQKLNGPSPGATPSELARLFREELSARLRISADLSPWSTEGSSGEPPRTIVALVGPPGAGKTTMLAKLAVRYGISARRSTHILAYDGHRIAPSEQLRAYAAILGVGFEALDTPAGLAQSIKENARKELILIDTPGYSAADFEHAGELARFLSVYPHVDTHLVLSCSAKSSDLSRMVDRYSVFGPAKLLFTRLDETESYGAIVNESIRTGLELSFLGTGSGVPDDLTPATADRVVDLLLEGRASRAVATA
jgi:flagellar biosynthesis protein FlhF